MNKMTAVGDRGLKIERGETGAINDRSKNPDGCWEGVDYNEEFNQPKPFFFSREWNNFPLTGHFRGRTAFLICGGPSFNNLSDEQKQKLKNVWSMGVNNSVKSFRPDAWLCVDDPSRFLKSIWLDPKIMKFVPTGHTEKYLWDSRTNSKYEMKVGECPNMYYFRRNNKFKADRWLREATLNWGNHEEYGGGRSCMLPAIKILYLLGFRTVYLVGCDLSMSSDAKYHFEEKRDKGSINCNNKTYKRLIKEYFPSLQKDFLKRGFHIFNINKDSAEKTFPYVSFDKAYADATREIGDTETEPTLGMYVSPAKKEELVKESGNVISRAEIEKQRQKNISHKKKIIEANTVVNVQVIQGKVYKVFADKNKELLKSDKEIDEWCDYLGINNPQGKRTK